MTVLNFPASPSNGDTYEENGVIYTWNGSYWSANNATDLGNIYVAIAGDRMTGNLELPGGGGDTAALQKQEIQLLIDAGGGGGTGPTDLYWERDAGALSPKVSTDNVDIGDGKILLNADGSITAAGGQTIFDASGRLQTTAVDGTVLTLKREDGLGNVGINFGDVSNSVRVGLGKPDTFSIGVDGTTNLVTGATIELNGSDGSIDAAGDVKAEKVNAKTFWRQDFGGTRITFGLVDSVNVPCILPADVNGGDSAYDIHLGNDGAPFASINVDKVNCNGSASLEGSLSVASYCNFNYKPEVSNERISIGNYGITGNPTALLGYDPSDTIKFVLNAVEGSATFARSLQVGGDADNRNADGFKAFDGGAIRISSSSPDSGAIEVGLTGGDRTFMVTANGGINANTSVDGGAAITHTTNGAYGQGLILNGNSPTGDNDTAIMVNLNGTKRWGLNYAGVANFSNAVFNLEQDDPTKYTTDVDYAGNEIQTYIGATLDVKESIETAVAARAAMRETFQELLVAVQSATDFGELKSAMLVALEDYA